MWSQHRYRQEIPYLDAILFFWYGTKFGVFRFCLWPKLLVIGQVRVACHLHVLQFEYEVKYTKEAIVPTRLSPIYMSPKIMGAFWLCLFLCMCLARTQIPPIRAPWLMMPLHEVSPSRWTSAASAKRSLRGHLDGLHEVVYGWWHHYMRQYIGCLESPV